MNHPNTWTPFSTPYNTFPTVFSLLDKVSPYPYPIFFTPQRQPPDTPYNFEPTETRFFTPNTVPLVSSPFLDFPLSLPTYTLSYNAQCRSKQSKPLEGLLKRYLHPMTTFPSLKLDNF
ncbi:uncharacterized protein YALI1_A14109g [Yarrowia lipolytica]|uniref:Uncharacterized protein n=1 Tax=Yarrowia lipolytica TaxID=4952 RepID=A0A1D8N4U3_YARLL|nr:hypothetical protein YALI1_A14109g [Yarrowia lipolytica]